MEQGTSNEKVYYKILNKSCQSLPFFISPEKVEGADVLEKNWKVFREELEAFQANGLADRESARTAHNYQPDGWKTITLLTYSYRYHSKCKHFPKTVSILEKIPGISLISINVLAPNAQIKGHHGDCNAQYRCSLGLTVPEGLPRCGIRVGNEERRWEEGKTLVFDDANRHRVWNNTDEYRVVIVIDIFKKEFRNSMWNICGKVWASFLMLHLSSKIPSLKKMPYILTFGIHQLLGIAMTAVLLFQRKLKIEIPPIS